MRVLHLIQRYPPAVGGSETWCREVSHYLDSSGDAVKVLTLTIRPSDVSHPPKWPYTYFTKQLTIPPRTSSTITIEYDWMMKANFQIGGASFPPDDLCQGEIMRAQGYALTVLLHSVEDTPLEALTLYQELMD